MIIMDIIYSIRFPACAAGTKFITMSLIRNTSVF